MTDLADLMERATASMPVDTRRLVNGGLDRAAVHRRRTHGRVAGAVAGVAGLAALVAVVVPNLAWQREHGVERAPYSSAPTDSMLRLLPDAEVLQRFSALLPGSYADVQTIDSDGDVNFEGQLTTTDGRTGLVMGDFGVGPAFDPATIADNKRTCVQMQRTVSDLDGTSCVLIDGGMIEIWDDTVPPEDPGNSPASMRLAYVHLSTWDGAGATLRSLNSTSDTAEPEPGAVPVVRTQELVDVVKQMEWYVQK
jgi:hypothetical protein